MRITFLGQAGLFIETKGKSILCDPWFNPAYFASWFPFPSNEGIDPARIGNPTYLYISHLHHDHYDPKFLAEHVSKEATVILPDYPLNYLEQELRALGFTSFLQTKNNVPVTVDGLKFMVTALVAPTDGPIGDSALIIDDGDVRVLNQNDSRPIDLDPIIAQGPFDAHFLQFSGAIWYPMVYDFPQKMKDALGRKKRADGLARAYRYIEMLNPRFVVPSAGPPCFLDEDLFALNDFNRDISNPFPDQPVFLDYIAERGVYDGRLMLPGSVGELTPGSFTIMHPLPDAEVQAIFTDKTNYLRAYQARKWDVIQQERASWKQGEVDVVAELKQWFEPLLAEADLICAGVDDRVLLDLMDVGVLLDFHARTVTQWQDEEWAYRFRIERSLVEECIRRHHEDWVNELFLSCRFVASRRGKYNDYIYTFFKCLSEERLQYAEGFYAENGPTQGTWEAAGYRIQKRCPHMKADLTRFAVIEDGILTCRLHNWQYELATGRCLTSEGHTLYCKPIQQEAAGD
ncbi:MAG TPA: MBL fold metallo-hydrolase [Ktedonobacterales bacterium]|nr:MBL fold metallo-hydrolase [Ktedonobacterales bacterium]